MAHSARRVCVDSSLSAALSQTTFGTVSTVANYTSTLYESIGTPSAVVQVLLEAMGGDVIASFLVAAATGPSVIIRTVPNGTVSVFVVPDVIRIQVFLATVGTTASGSLSPRACTQCGPCDGLPVRPVAKCSQEGPRKTCPVKRPCPSSRSSSAASRPVPDENWAHAISPPHELQDNSDSLSSSSSSSRKGKPRRKA